MCYQKDIVYNDLLCNNPWLPRIHMFQEPILVFHIYQHVVQYDPNVGNIQRVLKKTINIKLGKSFCYQQIVTSMISMLTSD